MLKILRSILLAVAALFFLTGTAAALSIKDVRVIDDGVSAMYFSVSDTVGAFFEEHDIAIQPADVLNMALTDKLSADKNYITTIEIVRGITVLLVIDGEAETIRVPAGTITGLFIRDIERERDIKLFYEGKTSALLKEGDQIAVYRVTQETTVQTVPIPYETITEEDHEMFEGTQEVIRAGVPGEEKVVTQASYVQGARIDEEITRETIAEPISAYVRVGTKTPPTPLEALLNDAQKLVMEASAYTSGFSCTGKRPGDPGYGITASGLKAERGVVAVDPSVIPLGTRLYVEGYGHAVAADTGGAIKGHKIDLFYDDYDEAILFGRRKLTVYVLASES